MGSRREGGLDMSDAGLMGAGEFRYRAQPKWETMPEGYEWREVAGVATDADDNVYVFNRGEHPMMVFDRDGRFVRSWGEGVFTRAHGVSVGPDNTLYCTDDGDHTVRQCALDGEVLMTLGLPGEPAPLFSGQPFNRCTHTALDPKTGDIYVSDGYGNSRVHKYSAEGRLLFSWGAPGTDPGEFSIAHNIVTDADGYVYVADRENHRIQIFDSEGNFEDQWPNVHRPCALYISAEQHIYVGELGLGDGGAAQCAEYRAAGCLCWTGAGMRWRGWGAGTGLGRGVYIAAWDLRGFGAQRVCGGGGADEYEQRGGGCAG